MLNVYFWNENEKMFQIALESNLKKELDGRTGVGLHYFDR